MVWNANQRRAAREVLAREVKVYEDMFKEDWAGEIADAALVKFVAVLNFACRLGIITNNERRQFTDSACVLSGFIAE